jgi:two-component system, cell cycle response regulator
MGSGGHTTMIQRVLERRAQKPPSSEEGTIATVAVLVRVLPPPKALLVFEDSMLGQHTERRIAADLLNFQSVNDELQALSVFKAEFRPVILTDNPEFVRKMRGGQGLRTPFIIYVSGRDDPMEREEGLRAGADDCVERRATDEEFNARVRGARRITELEAVVRTALSENRKLSATDDLTRVASRRFFGKNFPREVERAARKGLPLSVILCDIDHFKKINDTAGHPAGDDVLRQFGLRLQKGLRTGIDWVARIGGEEFAVIMPETRYDEALLAARKLRAAIAHAPFKSDKKSLPVTASFGLCTSERVPAGDLMVAKRLLKVADAALYRSKHGGRNRVTAATLSGADRESTEIVLT